MSTQIHTIDQVSCSLYVGDRAYIYSFDYDYDPREGVKITIYFVTENGVYNIPATLNADCPFLSVIQKSQISIGTAQFSMYPLSYSLDQDVARKVLKVDFIDETFLLSNYYIVLTGTYCGDRVYALGSPVDNRTDAQRVAAALDPIVQNIRNQATSLDIEYHFSDFLAKLTLALPRVTVNAAWDDTITKPFVGSFREVLDDWVQYHNLIYYFEEGALVINNPQSLNITFPAIPADALTIKQSESLQNTFTATSSVVFAQDGGQVGANGNTTTSISLYPVGAEFDLPQQTVDLNQVAAAAYGQEYWFIWNYLNGTATNECGWTRIGVNQLVGTLLTSVQNLLGNTSAGGLAYLNEDVFNQRFDFYSQYGKTIAGRYYLSSDQGGSIYSQQTYQWFNQTNGTTFSLSALLNGAAGPALSLGYYLDGVTPGNGYLEGTPINRYYPGVLANGNRLVYVDNRQVDLLTPFSLTDAQKGLLQTYYKNLAGEGITASSALDYSQVSPGNIRYIVFQDQVIDTTVIPAGPTDAQVALFNPASSIVNLVGVKQGAVVQSNAENGANNLITTTAGSSVVNAGTVTTLAQPNANLYYAKIAQCFSQSSLGKAGSRGAFGHHFNPRTLSPDSIVPFSLNKTAANAYTLARNLSQLQIPAQGGATDPATNILTKTSTSQIQSRKTLEFSLNYFYPGIPPSRFITNGLTSLSVSITEGGLTASYVFSNSMLDVTSRDDAIFFDKLQMNLRNSLLRQYNPQSNTSF